MSNNCCIKENCNFPAYEGNLCIFHGEKDHWYTIKKNKYGEPYRCWKKSKENVKKFWEEIRKEKILKQDFNFSYYIFPIFERSLIQQIQTETQELFPQVLIPTIHNSYDFFLKKENSEDQKNTKNITPNTKKKTFTENTIFYKSKFLGEAYFQGVTFKKTAKFTRSTFEDKVVFRTCNFHGIANFYKTEFQEYTNFIASNFYKSGSFIETKFKNILRFNQVKIKEGKLTFARTKFNRKRYNPQKDIPLYYPQEQRQSFEEISKIEDLKQKSKEIQKNRQSMIYLNSIAARFQGVEFNQNTIFRNCNLEQVSFINSNVEVINFTNCKGINTNIKNIFDHEFHITSRENTTNNSTKKDIEENLGNVLNLYSKFIKSFQNTHSALELKKYIIQRNDLRIKKIKMFSKTEDILKEKKLCYAETHKFLESIGLRDEANEFLIKQFKSSIKNLWNPFSLNNCYRWFSNYSCSPFRSFLWLLLQFLIFFTIYYQCFTNSSGIQALLYSLTSSIPLLSFPEEFQHEKIHLYLTHYVQVILSSIFWGLLILSIRHKFKK